MSSKQYAGTVIVFYINARRPRLTAALLEHDPKASTTIDFVAQGGGSYGWNTYAAPLAFSLLSGQLGLAAVLLKLGAKTYTTIEQCQALEELPAVQKSRPSWDRHKLDFYPDTMQPVEASLTNGNYGYKLLLASKNPPPVTAPLSSFISTPRETTLARVSTLSSGPVSSGASFLPPSQDELKQAVEKATTWREKFVARYAEHNGVREWSCFLNGGDSSIPALDGFVEGRNREIALAHVEYFLQARDDLVAYKAPSTWEQLLPLLTPPFEETASSRRNLDGEADSYYQRELLKYRQRRQIEPTAIVFRTYEHDAMYHRENSLPRHLMQRAQELFDAVEQGNDEKLRQLTLPSKEPLSEELLHIAMFAEEPTLEYDRYKMSPVHVALDAGKWETIGSIMDICSLQHQASDKKSKYSLQVGHNYESDDDGSCGEN